jgi:hypothetical protein
VGRRILGEDVTQIEYTTERVKRMAGNVHLQRHHPLRPGHLRPCGRSSRRLLRSNRAERRRYLAEGQRGGATTRGTAAAVPPAHRCLPRATRRGGVLFAHAKACGFGHRSRHRTPISGSIKYPGGHPCHRPLRMLRRRLLLGKPCTRGPWRWTTSCRGTRAAQTTSATCRPSASAAMPVSDGRREQAHSMESASPSGCLEPLSTSETQCLAVARERTAIRS